MDFIFMGLLSCIISGLFILEITDVESNTNKRAYERVHKGEIKCIDIPDGTVYCYKAKEE